MKAGYPRLLPVTILATVMLLGVKVADVWEGARALQVGVGTKTAKAADPPKGEGTKPAEVSPADIPSKVEDAPVSPFTKSEMSLLQDLSKRREELDKRAGELDLRENLLVAAEKRIDEKIAELKKLEASVKSALKQVDDETERNLRSLVKVYENMKPKDAARIFASLDSTVLLGVVERMKEAKLAPILTELDPKVAQQLTVDLAKRRQVTEGKGGS